MKALTVGQTGRALVEVKYGSRFPEIGDEWRVVNSQGTFVAKYLRIGAPKWTPKFTVQIPVTIKIIEVVCLATPEKVRQSGLTLIREDSE
jgi:hypothetical protein